jgi:hypothetical protein
MSILLRLGTVAQSFTTHTTHTHTRTHTLNRAPRGAHTQSFNDHMYVSILIRLGGTPGSHKTYAKNEAARD